MQTRIERFELVEKIAEAVFIRLSAQIVGVKVDHDIWTGAYALFRNGTVPMPFVELSLDLTAMMLDLVNEDTRRNSHEKR